jgi:hypothetical protein
VNGVNDRQRDTKSFVVRDIRKRGVAVIITSDRLEDLFTKDHPDFDNAVPANL